MFEVAYEELVHETDGAYLFNVFNDGGDDIWIPKSQIEDLDEKEKTFSIPQWLADKNNMEYE